jgi:hypothetical protein
VSQVRKDIGRAGCFRLPKEGVHLMESACFASVRESSARYLKNSQLDLPIVDCPQANGSQRERQVQSVGAKRLLDYLLSKKQKIDQVLRVQGEQPCRTGPNVIRNAWNSDDIATLPDRRIS